ncbi:MAG: BACON domain-containing protein [Rheinheimera sp.]
MRSKMLIKTITKFWFILVAAMFLISCGGDGGSDKSGTFNLSQTKIEISGYEHLLRRKSHTINMTITGRGVVYAGAAYAYGQIPAKWLSIDITGSDKNYVLTLTVNPTYLSTGTSTAAFTVGTTDAEGNILASKVVTVSATSLISLQTYNNQRRESLVYGAVEKNLAFQVPFTADRTTKWQISSNQGWLTLDEQSGQGSATFNATVDTTKLAPGIHQAKITVQDTQVAENKFDFDYQLKLDKPQFDFSGTDGTLGGDDGLAQDTLSITFASKTGKFSYPYSLTFNTSNNIAWLTSDEDSGVVNETGKTLKIRSIAPESMAGTFTATATLRVIVGEVEFSQQLNITLNKEISLMSLGAQAVALSSAPDKSLLSRSIPVLNSLGRTDLTWQAKSDKSWLTVTPSGTMGQNVTLQADPTGLAANQTFFATVTVTPDGANAGGSEQIKVGFTVLSAVPKPQVIKLPETDSTYDDFVFHAVNPLKPEIVIAYNNSLIAYNTNTAQQLYSIDRTIAGIGGITFAADGSKVFVYDNVNMQIVSFDAQSRSKLATYQLRDISSNVLGLLHVRQNGRNLLYGAPGIVFDTDSGIMMPLNGNTFPPSGRSLNAGYAPSYIVDENGSIYHSYYSALHGGQIRSSSIGGAGYYSSNAAQACFEPTGTFIYTASGSPYVFPGYNRLTKAIEKKLPGQAYPNAIVCAADGLIIGGTNSYYNETDIFVYSSNGNNLAMLNSATDENGYRRLVNRGLSVSSDAGQLIAVSERYSGNTEIKFMRLPKAD